MLAFVDSLECSIPHSSRCESLKEQICRKHNIPASARRRAFEMLLCTLEDRGALRSIARTPFKIKVWISEQDLAHCLSREVPIGDEHEAEFQFGLACCSPARPKSVSASTLVH